MRRRGRRYGRGFAAPIGRRKSTGEQTHCCELDVTFAAGDLPGKTPLRPYFQA